VKRGDVVIIAERGALTGKPRPAVIIQTDVVNDQATRVIVALIGASGPEAPSVRIAVLPDAENGLAAPSRIMVDRIATVARTGIARRIGRIDPATMRAVDDALRRWLGL
jgi:mRNA interferase MazF